MFVLVDLTRICSIFGRTLKMAAYEVPGQLAAAVRPARVRECAARTVLIGRSQLPWEGCL